MKKSIRELALIWWNSQHISAKNFLTDEYYYNRVVSSLTGREIEKIYVKEKDNV